MATPAPVKTVPVAEVVYTGSANSCIAGQRLSDDDGDSWGECVPDDVAVNSWLAQAAAQESGLPAGTTCPYPPTITAGETSVITCPTVNVDGSEGTWSFVLASDSSVHSAASYAETKSAPATTAPPTLPPTTQAPVQPAVSTTDPRFDTCKKAKANGYGPYYAGETEYGWYRDADSDGVVCE